MLSAKQVNQHSRLYRPLLSILITLAIIIVFNFVPNAFAYLITLTDRARLTAELASVFWNSLLWLDVWWGAFILLNIAYLLIGSWTRLTRVAEIIITVYGIAVLIWSSSAPAFNSLPWLSFLIKIICIVMVLRILKSFFSTSKSV